MTSTPSTTRTIELRDEIIPRLDDFLPDGFEIDDGGQGGITIDVQAGTVTIEHRETFVEYHDTSMEFSL